MEKQLNDNDGADSISAVENQMLSLLAQFEIGKGQLKHSTRRQLRDRFLRLGTTQFNNQTTTTAILLADHAFKLAQRMFHFLLKSILLNMSS
jgi:hypothetical protein